MRGCSIEHCSSGAKLIVYEQKGINMFDQFSDGYCPECQLKNEMRDMILNDSDFWECPVCHLQARSGGGFFVLLRTSGNGRRK